MLVRRWTVPATRTTGVLAVEGLDADVLIRRDRYGIVHIEAAGYDDACFASGFCQGQDRSRRAQVASGAGGRFESGVRAGSTLGRRRAPLPAIVLARDLPAEDVEPPWYLVHLRTPGLHVAGAQAVGGPEIVAGHDEVILWPSPPGSLNLLRMELKPDVPPRDWGALRVAYPGGQCDDPESPHFEDLTPFWHSAHGVPLAWTRDEVAVATRATLRLTSSR